LPVMLQSRRRQRAESPRCPVGCPSADRGGTGIVMVMGLWNFLRLGSTVTMGLKVALLPRMALTMSSGTGWACRYAAAGGWVEVEVEEGGN